MCSRRWCEILSCNEIWPYKKNIKIVTNTQSPLDWFVLDCVCCYICTNTATGPQVPLWRLRSSQFSSFLVSLFLFFFAASEFSILSAAIVLVNASRATRFRSRCPYRLARLQADAHAITAGYTAASHTWVITVFVWREHKKRFNKLKQTRTFNTLITEYDYVQFWQKKTNNYFSFLWKHNNAQAWLQFWKNKQGPLIPW